MNFFFIVLGMVATVGELLALSWSDMAAQIPEPPSASTVKKDDARARRTSVSASQPRKRVAIRSTNSSNPDISYGQQKMGM